MWHNVFKLPSFSLPCQVHRLDSDYKQLKFVCVFLHVAGEFRRPGFYAQWQVDRINERVNFILRTTLGEYAALGISDDQKMVRCS